MLRRYLSRLLSDALAVIALAKPLIEASVRLKDLRLLGNLSLGSQEIPLNVMLSAIVVGLGLLAIFITPILPLLMLGTLAFILSSHPKAAKRFMMMGGLSTGFGALAAVGVPSSSIMSMRLEGPSLAAFDILPNFDSHVIFVIAAIGVLSIYLTPVQRDTLAILAKIHRQEGRAVKGKEIGELMDRDPETIRIQLRSLKNLNLVKSLTGPNGGYTATETAYNTLSMDNNGNGDKVAVSVVRNGILVKGASAAEIVFNNVMHSICKNCVSIHIIGNISDFSIGDEIEIGPTPVNKLYIRGKVIELDKTTCRVVLDIIEMISIPRIPVKNVARRAVRLSPNASLKEASKILVINGAQEALVDDISPGLVNMVDITRAVAEGRTDLEVREIMTPGFLTINSDAPIFEAVKMLGKTGARQLVVLDRGSLWGIVTPRDLMESLSPS